MDRLLGDWLDSYVAYTKRSEPPTSYHLWTAISVIAGALQRKAYMHWNVTRLFPNMYIALVGPSGKCRKSTAMGFGLDLLKRIQGVHTGAQLVTAQMLIRDLKEAIESFTNPVNGNMEFHCSMTVMASEMSVFLGSNNIEFLSMLTSMFDSEDEWEYRTKTQGTDKITGLCLNILGGTAPDWIATMIPQAALGGGFTSRFIFVVERDKGRTITDPRLSTYQRDMREKLIKDLATINLLAGEFRFTDEAFEKYDRWYNDTEKQNPKGLANKYFEGYCSRRATHARKLGMIVSASRGNDMMINAQDFDRAVRILESAELTMPQAFSGLGKARYSDLNEMVLNYMVRKHLAGTKEFRHSELLRVFFNDLDAYTLGIVMQTLIEMRVVELKISMDGAADKVYVFKGGI